MMSNNRYCLAKKPNGVECQNRALPRRLVCGQHLTPHGLKEAKSNWLYSRMEALESALARKDERIAELEAQCEVWSGRACQEEQEAGNGPCGACRHCLPGLKEAAEKERDELREELKRDLGCFLNLKAFETLHDAHGDAVRGRIKAIRAALRPTGEEGQDA